MVFLLKCIKFSIHTFFYDDFQVSSLANSIRVLANMEEPVGRVLKRMEVRKWGAYPHNITIIVLAGD